MKLNYAIHWLADEARRAAEAIGRANALEALDQAAQYSTLADAVDAYAENVGDTLVEQDLEVFVRFAERAYRDTLTAKGIKFDDYGVAHR